MLPTRTRKAQGFTLVEILIVVVILGILAAIVIPQFTSASESAKASSLTSQLQTLRSQLELYQVQHDGAYPAAPTAGSADGELPTWPAMTTQVGDFGPYLQRFPANPFVTTDADIDDPTLHYLYNATTGAIQAVIPANITDAEAATLGLDDPFDFRRANGDEIN